MEEALPPAVGCIFLKEHCTLFPRRVLSLNLVTATPSEEVCVLPLEPGLTLVATLLSKM